MSNFDNLKTESSILMEDNISKLPKKEGNLFKRQDKSTDDFNDLENKLLDPPEELLLEPLEEPWEKSSSSTENIR